MNHSIVTIQQQIASAWENRGASTSELEAVSEQLLEKSLAADYQEGQLVAQVLAIYAHFRKGNYEHALKTSFEHEDQWRDELAPNWNCLRLWAVSCCYNALGFPDEFLAINYESERLARKIDLSGSVVVALRDRGSFLVIQGDHDEGISLLKNALQLAIETNDDNRKLHVLVNLSGAYCDIGNYSEAVETAERLLTSGLDNESKLPVMANLALAHMNLEQYELSEQYLKSALTLSQELSLKSRECTLMGNLGDLNFRRKDLQQAADNHRDQLALAEALNFQAEIVVANKALATIYRQLNQWQEAYAHLEESNRLDQQSFNERSDLRTQVLQVKHEVELLRETNQQKQREAELLQASNAELSEEVAKRKQAEEEVRQRASQLEVLVDTTREISRLLNPEQVLNQIADHARTSLLADASAIYTREEGVLSPAIVLGRNSEEIRALNIEMGQGILGHIAEHGQPEIIVDAAADPRARPIPGTTPKETERMMVAPLIADKRPIGLLVLWRSGESTPFGLRDLNFLTGLAQQAVIAIANSQLFNDATQARSDAEQASKAKSVFLANMNHELRSPLQSIMGCLELARMQDGLSADMQEYLTIIEHSSTHLLSVINQVLDVVKLEAGRMTLNSRHFNLVDLLTEVDEMFQISVRKKGITLECKTAADLPTTLQTDDVKLRQVLINLLSNAIKFTDKGGVSLEVTTTESRDKLWFTVSDTGTGIAPDQIDQIFEMFTQADAGVNSQQGTGLGMPISRSFVQLMGGDLTIESQLGVGTRLSFNILTAS